jgi:glycosyltransferase involved in cell wall biosynthesis
MKKITIMSLHLGYGGIEKSVVSLANNLAHDYDVEILSVYKLYDKSPHEIDSNVKVKYLMDGDIALKTDKYKKSIRKLQFIKLFKLLFKDYRFNIFKLIKDTFLSVINVINKRKLVKKYLLESNSDVVISTRDYLNKILGKYGKKNQIKIGWEHNHYNGNLKYFKKICNSVVNLDYFVLVSKELFDDYSKALKGTNCRCVLIPNMVDIKNAKLSKLGNNNLITVSRFSAEKGIFDLIDVVEIVIKDISDIKLNLIGDGSLFDEVYNVIKNKKLEDNIRLLGYRESDDVYSYLSNSSLYVMTSFTESFGIVLLEAFSFGVPAIAFDSANGACEIITSENVFLIPNRDKNMMAKTIVKYLNDKELQQKLSKGTQKNLSRFSAECVIILWKDLFR